MSVKNSIYVNKLFIVYFVYVRPCRIVVAYLFAYPLFLYCTSLLLVYFLIPVFFILTLLLYFCLFVNHTNKSIIFVFGPFVYNFKDSISIFVTILLFRCLTCDLDRGLASNKQTHYLHYLCKVSNI